MYDAAGTKVFQQAWDNQAFGADQTRTYRSNWSVASTATSGSYTVKIGIFGTGWFAFYAWNDRATAFTDDIRVRDLLRVANVADVINNVVGIFLEIIIGRTIKSRSAAIIINA